MEIYEAKTDGNSSPMAPHSTEEVARAAVAAAQSVRPSPSIVISAKQQNNHNLHKWKRQFQKVWKWGTFGRESNLKPSFNPEVLASQKRQWYELHLKALKRKQHTEPTNLFEHFVLVGLPSNANVDVIESAFARKKSWETSTNKDERLLDGRRQRNSSVPTLEPQILFKYPPGKRLAMRSKDLPAFCFPGGVKARVMERTPSMSDLNEVVYGQEHLKRDDLTFIFSLKVADNTALYGVCVYVHEIVQRPPGILAMTSTMSESLSSSSRFLVSAPRCYCILTKLPFFDLHYEVLNSIIAQERLERITQFVNEMTLADYTPSTARARQKSNDGCESPLMNDSDEWMACAIPVDGVFGATAAAAGLISEGKITSFSSRTSEPTSPGSAGTSEASDANQVKEWDGDVKEAAGVSDDHLSEVSEVCSDTYEKANGAMANGHACGMIASGRPLQRIESSDSIYSSIRSIDSEDEDDSQASVSGRESSFDTEEIMTWAKANNNELLQIVCGYHSLPVPSRGSAISFQPLEHLSYIDYQRPGEASLKSMGGRISFKKSCETSLESAEINTALVAAEEALALSLWTVSTVCRVLSVQSVLALIAGALLEKQMILICPNLGILSATVLSLIPMIRPFEWQSLMLPVMADFMNKVMNASFEPSRIVLTAGSTAAIEALGFCLADPGNAFLVPSPYYPGFDRDLKWRANVELVPVPCRSSDNFLVTMTALDRAYMQAKKRGLAVRALLITNPSNPVGNLMNMDMLSGLLEFATEKNIHLICNELYAASVYDESRFTSIARLLDTGDYDKSRVHIIYGLSKDLCLPGFRVGVLYSYNDRVLKAVQRLARFCSVSTQTQKMLSTMLSDSSFIEKYLTENQKRLKERSSIFVEGLKEAGIRCIKGNAGLYCWVEMASLMPSYNEKGELILWQKILSEAKINVTPGSACHCIEPGWFRFTFTNLRDHEMAVAVKRIQEFAAHCKINVSR